VKVYLLLVVRLGTPSCGGDFVSGTLELQRLGLVRVWKQLLLMRRGGGVLEAVLDVFDALLGLLLQQVRRLGSALAGSSRRSSTAVWSKVRRRSLLGDAGSGCGRHWQRGRCRRIHLVSLAFPLQEAL